MHGGQEHHPQQHPIKPLSRGQDIVLHFFWQVYIYLCREMLCRNRIGSIQLFCWEERMEALFGHLKEALLRILGPPDSKSKGDGNCGRKESEARSSFKAGQIRSISLCPSAIKSLSLCYFFKSLKQWIRRSSLGQNVTP